MLDLEKYDVKIGERTVALNVIQGTDADCLRKVLGDLSGSEKQLPGGLPISIDKSHLPDLAGKSYWLAEKTDGMRFIFLAATYKNVFVNAIFDRSLVPYLVWMKKMPTQLAQGTVFDGELAYDAKDKRWVYLIFDAVVVAGVDVRCLPFSERLHALKQSFWCYELTPEDPVEFRIKDFLRVTKDVIPAFNAHAESQAERFCIDGIVFVPEHEGVVYGRHNTMFKLKQRHTVDFLVKNGKLVVYDDKKRRNRQIGPPGGSEKHLAVEGAIVEAELVGSVWHVIQRRTDKKTSNTLFVYEKTMLNMQENLQLTDVVNAIYK